MLTRRLSLLLLLSKSGILKNEIQLCIVFIIVSPDSGKQTAGLVPVFQEFFALDRSRLRIRQLRVCESFCLVFKNTCVRRQGEKNMNLRALFTKLCCTQIRDFEPRKIPADDYT